MKEKKPVFILTGPTGCGKTEIIENLPDDLPIEIISADSRQVYKLLKIGTAMPSDEVQKKYPHHLLNFLSLRERFSAGKFVKESLKLILEIHERNKIPVVVGGTFFYILSLWDGLLKEPEIPIILKNEVEDMTYREAWEELSKLDPISAEKIGKNDVYRTKRALLITMASDKPFSMHFREGGIYNEFNFTGWYLDLPREELYERINKRVYKMFDDGLLNEIDEVFAHKYSSVDPGLRTIGYREILRFYERLNPKPSSITKILPVVLNDIKELISISTRRFAKRQLTWFRNESRLIKLEKKDALQTVENAIKAAIVS
ncbi:MAG: tRNA (adenosine(37)-N6)-dimethylallyltransferase MiaA [Spirochaetia bacterium]|nr:tRNA (adenosine(37)-N6)-dimethylallyltransferase MiaA [Spirochaetia bacterium]